MTGPHDSIIGMRADLILKRFVTGLPVSFKAANGGVRLQALQVDVDEQSGVATAVERLDIPLDD